MYTTVILLKRRPDMSLEEFQAYYRDRHGPLMARLMAGRGLVSYEHFPVDRSVTTGRYMTGEESGFDAVSIYTYESKQHCEECWGLPDVITDSARCMDVETMLILPTGRRTVFPSQ